MDEWSVGGPHGTFMFNKKCCAQIWKKILRFVHSGFEISGVLLVLGVWPRVKNKDVLTPAYLLEACLAI
jgi:hypothetical protein